MYNEQDILKQFGRNVKAERVRQGYSQEALAEKSELIVNTSVELNVVCKICHLPELQFLQTF